mmetsp:Transcript_33799/g.39764  ORF Transcript_33799/g.39764 Transcript_33799/m.39764 type:complete len:149 (+) Transcript_33799:36-482(+)
MVNHPSAEIAALRNRTQFGHKPCVVALMRHGQRMDKAISVERLKTSFAYNDPPLTEAGRTDAYQKGYLILAYKFQLEQRLNGGKPFDKVIVESSPFLRTMQTAAFVCKALHIPSFRLNYEFCEHLEPKMQVGSNPIPMLTVKQIETDE